MRSMFTIALWLLAALGAQAQTTTVLLTTMNCYWFLGQEDNKAADKPRSKAKYELKAGHLVGLLPGEAPLFIALQEVGNGEDVQALAKTARTRYGRNADTCAHKMATRKQTRRD